MAVPTRPARAPIAPATGAFLKAKPVVEALALVADFLVETVVGSTSSGSKDERRQELRSRVTSERVRGYYLGAV